MKRGIALLCCLLILLGCSSCQDSSEVNDDYYAIFLGVDSDEQKKMMVTVGIINFKSAKDAGSLETKVFSESGDSIEEVIEHMGIHHTRQISIGHVQLLVISQEYAKQGVGDVVTELMQDTTSGDTMGVTISEGTAKEFIESHCRQQTTDLTQYLHSATYWESFDETLPTIPISYFYQSIYSTCQEPIALYAKVVTQQGQTNQQGSQQSGQQGSQQSGQQGSQQSGQQGSQQSGQQGSQQSSQQSSQEVQNTGIAVFRRDKFVGMLDQDASMEYLLLAGRVTKGRVSLEDFQNNQEKMIVEFRNESDPQIEVERLGQTPKINITLNLSGIVWQVPGESSDGSAADLEKQDDQITQQITKRLQALLDRLQQQEKSDILGLGKEVVASFLTVDEWEAYGWLDRFPQTELTVSVKYHTTRTGTFYQRPTEQDTK